MFDLITSEALVALLTLTALEIVLGVDNLLFLSIQVSKLPAELRKKAERIGLMISAGLRLVLVFFAAWLLSMNEPLFTLAGVGFSVKGLVLLGGGLFLGYHAVHEIHDATSRSPVKKDEREAASSFPAVIARVSMLGLVFSIDSVVTAIGMTQTMWVIYLSIFIAVGFMVFAAPHVTTFIERRPGFKILGVCFLLLIATLLGAEALGFHMPKSIVYTSIAFATFAFWIEDLRTKSYEAGQISQGNICPTCQEPLAAGKHIEAIIKTHIGIR
jgi:predicted tellurium resistance membrane protein TerC